MWERPTVDEIRVLTLESFPVKAFAYVTGYLPDATSQIDRVEQRRAGDLITIELGASRPAAAVGATALEPFEEQIPLDVLGLPAGRYRVSVNGVEGVLVLDRDNGVAPSATPGGTGALPGAPGPGNG